LDQDRNEETNQAIDGAPGFCRREIFEHGSVSSRRNCRETWAGQVFRKR
jgi:hypothetical protein